MAGKIGRAATAAAMAVALGAALSGAAQAKGVDVVERPIAALQADMTAGKTTSADLVKAYLKRIDKMDRRGPTLRSVISVNPDALADAKALDAERAAKGPRGPLHGVPVLLKDNIDTEGKMPTTAGSLALRLNIAGEDAPVAARLRAAGAVILGKTNLSEWANIRSDYSISGWSAVGGQVRNPYVLDRNPCGSSSGSGAATAASFAAASVGTETNGSIVCPSTVAGLVGVKPTVGLVSRRGIIPISVSQDTAGPMTRTVADAAALLTVMAGSDPGDPATKEADARKTDYVKALDPKALAGKRLGVFKGTGGYSPGVDAAFEAAKAALSAAGATIVEIEPIQQREINEAQGLLLRVELKAGLADYLGATAPTVKTRTLEDVIAFNAATPAETALFGQDFFIEADKSPGVDDPKYLEAKAKAKRLAGPEGLDKVLAASKLDAVIGPTGAPAWTTDAVNGDHFLGGFSNLAAVAGYPHVTVPMGQVQGLPVGLSFVGTAWSEAPLLAMAYAYEQRTSHRKPPTYAATIAIAQPAIAEAQAGIDIR
ncbi:MAG: amidase [Alphaproteobacteria bacterium]|nr:amidase [Alphaproteobacteria bacterium]